jgi:transposase
MLCLTEGQMSDHIGAKLLYPMLPNHNCAMIGDKGYDSDEYRAALQAKNIMPCILPRRGWLIPANFDANLYRQRHKVENLFARLKDWRRIHTRYYHRRYLRLLDQLMNPEPSLRSSIFFMKRSCMALLE